MLSRRSLALGAAILGAAPFLPSVAQAADVNALVPCVRAIQGEQTFQFTANGFAPGAPITVRADAQTVAVGAADATGVFTGAGPAPVLSSAARNQQTFQLTASDGTTTTAPKPLLVSRVKVQIPDRARPTRRVRYRAYGFAPGKRVYLHIRRNGKTLGRFSLGKAKGACGNTARKLRYMPLSRYSTGAYDYWFSQAKKYAKATRIYGLQIRIIRTAR
jgi:hypothetical protein